MQTEHKSIFSDSRQMKDITDDYGWELYYGLDTGRCPVALVFYAQKRRALGVHLTIAHRDEGGTITGYDTIGYFGTSGADMDTLRVLQPLAYNMLPSNPAWSLMWRNCYRVPLGVSIEDFEVKIFKGLPGREGVATNLDYQVVGGVAGDPYLKILGLDQWNNATPELKHPDGKIDDRIEIYRPEWGLIIFPHREPFNTDTTFVNANADRSDSLEVVIPTLYHYYSRSDKLSVSKYYLQVRTWQPDYIR